MTKTKPPRRGVPQPLQGGPQRFGPYLLQARLAVGGTSEVYLAERSDRTAATDSLPDRVIVKRLLPHLVADAEGRTMFEREAALHAAMTHDNIVTVFDSGVTEQGEPYLAMEYIDGCDAFRLLRRAVQTRAILPLPISIYVTREVLRGLGAVHRARDASGAPLHIVHRDVTPSNLYLSRTGEVKLGDFGIARSLHRAPTPTTTGEPAERDASLLGKFSYLSPEQVAGEPFDQRADLFSLATVLTEMIIGKPLFPGTGQLQVLLAIRDCKLLPLREEEARMPKPLVAVLERALARSPDARYPDADALSEALVPFQGDPASARAELAARVKAVQTISSETQLAAVRESARAMRAVRPESPVPPEAAALPGAASIDAVDVEFEVTEEKEHDTGVYPLLESFVERKSGGPRLGPWTFTRLVEAVATGAVKRGDLVDYIGMGLRPVEEIPDLARVLPAVASHSLEPAAGAPAYEVDLAQTTMVDVFAGILATGQSGRLIATRRSPDGRTDERSLFFLRGRLYDCTSDDAGGLLGDYLVRRGKIAKDELDLALAVLPNHGGRMGDTLVALGLVEGADIARATRELGRDRVIELFTWKEGSVALYPDAQIPIIDAPLDLDLPTLMLAGMEACHPGDAPMAFIEPHLDKLLVPNARADVAPLTYPPIVASVTLALRRPASLRDVLSSVTKTDTASGADVARALELLLAMDLVRWQA